MTTAAARHVKNVLTIVCKLNVTSRGLTTVSWDNQHGNVEKNPSLNETFETLH